MLLIVSIKTMMSCNSQFLLNNAQCPNCAQAAMVANVAAIVQCRRMERAKIAGAKIGRENTAPLVTETSQQPLLTTPQHA
jgi:hypothetical protein